MRVLLIVCFLCDAVATPLLASSRIDALEELEELEGTGLERFDASRGVEGWFHDHVAKHFLGGGGCKLGFCSGKKSIVAAAKLDASEHQGLEDSTKHHHSFRHALSALWKSGRGYKYAKVVAGLTLFVLGLALPEAAGALAITGGVLAGLEAAVDAVKDWKTTRSAAHAAGLFVFNVVKEGVLMAVGASVGETVDHVLGLVEWACSADAAIVASKEVKGRDPTDGSGEPVQAFAFRDDEEGTYTTKLHEAFPGLLTFTHSAADAAVRFATCGHKGLEEVDDAVSESTV